MKAVKHFRRQAEDGGQLKYDLIPFINYYTSVFIHFTIGVLE